MGKRVTHSQDRKIDYTPMSTDRLKPSYFYVNKILVKNLQIYVASCKSAYDFDKVRHAFSGVTRNVNLAWMVPGSMSIATLLPLSRSLTSSELFNHSPHRLLYLVVLAHLSLSEAQWFWHTYESFCYIFCFGNCSQ
jgi:hypothetical protein